MTQRARFQGHVFTMRTDGKSSGFSPTSKDTSTRSYYIKASKGDTLQLNDNRMIRIDTYVCVHMHIHIIYNIYHMYTICHIYHIYIHCNLYIYAYQGDDKV